MRPCIIAEGAAERRRRGIGADIRGIGIDVVEISRLERALRRRPRLERRCFTEAERNYCNRQRRPGQHFAGRFAAKEALAKALRAPVRWQEMEIESGGGPPQARLRGATAALARGCAVHLSISHSGDVAVAAAVVEGPAQ